MLSALLPIMKHRATWGVAVCIGFLAALVAHGKLRYHEGYRTGVVAERAVAALDAATAKAASDSAYRVMYRAALVSRDSAARWAVAAARAETRARLASARLADALTAVGSDTTPQTPACLELASACTNAAARWSEERDTLAALIAAQDRALLHQSAVIADEPARFRDAMHEALAQQRRTFRAPSRLTWASVGALLGTLVTLGVLR